METGGSKPQLEAAPAGTEGWLIAWELG